MANKLHGFATTLLLLPLFAVGIVAARWWRVENAYHHCSGHKSKCGGPYTREELLQDQFASALGDLFVPRDVLTWLAAAESDFNDTDWYDRLAQELQMQAAELASKIPDICAAEPTPLDDAIDLMDLTSRTVGLFKLQPLQEQQRFLRLALKSGTWQGGQLRTEFEEPFESVTPLDSVSRTKKMEVQMKQTPFEEWLPESYITGNRNTGSR